MAIDRSGNVATLLGIGAVACLLLVCCHVAAEGTGDAKRGQEILDAAGVRGGLVVHVGCGDGRLTAALRPNSSYTVHGLDASPARIAKARRHIQSLGRYGPVSVQQWDRPYLPYADNLADLVVASGECQVASEEITRVLAPGGVMISLQSSAFGLQPHRKPWPDDIDEWTHYLHGPDNNAVAQDRVVGPPQRVQWLAEPKWGRCHEKLSSISAAVSASGRIFAIMDEAPIASIALPPQWTLVARNAFNGILLWKRPLGTWEWPMLWHFSVTPPALPRRLVAVGDRVYLTPSYGEAVCALNAADGRLVGKYAGTENSCEIICAGGLLVCSINRAANAPPERKAADKYADMQLTGPTEIVAAEVDTGEILWRYAVQERLWLQTLAVAHGHVVFLAGNDIVCLEARTGEQRWRHALPDRPAKEGKVCGRPMIGRATLVVHPKAILVARGSKEITALSPETGKSLWSCPCGVGFRLPVDLFVTGDEVWVGESDAWQTAPDLQVARDLLTGKVCRRISTRAAFCAAHHHRCYRNKATERFFLVGRRGVEFIDHQQNTVDRHSWVRGACQYGVLPSNGLLYLPPHACSCYMQSKLNGFYALAPQRKNQGPRTKGTERAEGTATPRPTDRLEKGPAYGASSLLSAAAGLQFSSWPTYRHDAARSGVASTTVSPQLAPLWQAKLTAPLSPPVMARGLVFVAAKDAHIIHALDASNGTRRWRFTADSRIDSPPTIWQGRVLFGSTDGWAYCLRASDGQLCWRWRAAPSHGRIGVHDQLESPWPAHGSVLVRNDIAFVTAGRSSYVDGGIWLYRLDPGTGKLLSETRLYSRDPVSGEQPKESHGNQLPGHLSDILSSHGDLVFMRESAFDLQGTLTSRQEPHLYSPIGFLDDTGFHRAYWILGTKTGTGWGGWAKFDGVAAGRLLAFNDTKVYGYGRNRYRQPPGNVRTAFPLSGIQYRLFKADSQGKEQWSVRLPFEVRAMMPAGEHLFAAGPRGKTTHSPQAFAGQQGTVLWAIASDDGATLAEHELECPPVFDGMIAAQRRLVISMSDGKVACWD